MSCRTFATLIAIVMATVCTVRAKASEMSDYVSRPLVRVTMNPDFHPEVEFRIAEALKRPPIDWSMVQDHTLAEVARPVAVAEPAPSQHIAQRMIAEWEHLLASPAHMSVAETVKSHLRSIIRAEFAAQSLVGKKVATCEVSSERELAPIQEICLDDLPTINTGDLAVAEVSLDDLPQIHTGEEVMALIAQDDAGFPLDPYGYSEYNAYFEPEVYDWFVFATDDLTVVYVYENSDILPSRVDPVMLAEQNASPEVPEAFKVAVREHVRSLFAGEIDFRPLAASLQTGWSTVTAPFSIASLKQSELLPVHRVSQLPELFRF
ncbi:hypothetical protein AB1L30_26430 [Bremerella sp. JC817]|uniref:hypothetical protein n=1 Tax=Bremerella sp. JC817 TaxID=3231756 RepID=UPI003457A119